MNILIKPIIYFVVWLLVAVQAIHAQVNITATAIPPINPILTQLLSATGSGINVTISSLQDSDMEIVITGNLQRISPPAFSITVREDIRPDRPTLRLSQRARVPLTYNLFQRAYGNFNPDVLIFAGISLNELKDGLNYKLPEGQYRLCVRVLTFPELRFLREVCVNFNICYQAAAPQFTQPVNNMNLNASVPRVNPRSPVVFTWTPPRAICGSLANALSSLRYDLEIREILDNQTVTDAINNPFIFRKTLLPSPTFLLDTNLYKNILKEGKRYITRVRATVIDRNSPVVIDNFGYSRIEAFQYGDNSVVQINAPSPESFYIPFSERKTDFWDDALTAYKKKERTDTLVPIKEYIPLILASNGLVYSYDAIELLLVLNSEFYTSNAVRLSNSSTLPALPVVPQNKRTAFNSEHGVNLQPDAMEEITYKENVDSFTVLIRKQGITDTTARKLNTLFSQLNIFSQNISATNRVSMKMINELMAELIYQLRAYPQGPQNQPGQLETIVASLEELMAVSVNSSSSNFRLPFKKKSSLASFGVTGNSSLPIRFLPRTDEDGLTFSPPGMDALLSFDIIVYHYSKDQPPKPLLNTGDLTATYKVFYITSGLFNHKNPEINAKASTGPASTAQVSLPKTRFTFWTQSMFTKKQSKPQEVDLLDAFLNSKKRWPEPKRFSIVLKVD
ncbi:MAG: hypothetical protein WKF97_08680 [Chitinophagaceae bacterium]